MPPPLPLPPLPDSPPSRGGPTRRQWVVVAAIFAVVVPLAWAAGKFVHWSAAYTAGAAVQSVLTDQQDAWNRGDLDGFMAGYWADERLTFSSGDTVTRGWQATMDRYRKQYQSDGKEMGVLAFTDVEIEPLGPDAVAAFVRGRWGLVFAKSEEKPNGLFTLVMRKTPAGWKVVHDHTSAAEPPKKN